MLVHIPGNVLDGNWKARLYLDQDTSDAQQEGILNLWGGKLGGAITDLASLVGEVVSVEKTDLTFDVEGINGTIKIGDQASASIEAFKGATGVETKRQMGKKNWKTRRFCAVHIRAFNANLLLFQNLLRLA